MNARKNNNITAISSLKFGVIVLAILLGLGAILSGIYAAFNGDILAFATRVSPGIFLAGIVSWGLTTNSR